MAISKIQFKASAQATPVVWMDVTQDTVAAAHLETDYTAHDASGTQITGTLEPGGGPTYTWETVWSGQVVTTNDWGNEYYYAMITPFTESISYGSVWRITWDSVPYECTATWEGAPYADPYALGNNTYDDGQGGNNEPFFMQRYSGNELYVVSTNGTHTLTIEKQVESSGGGLEYETGIYIPASDIARPTISFTNTHSEAPAYLTISDVSSYETAQTGTNIGFSYIDAEKLFGSGFPYNASSVRYGLYMTVYRSTATTAQSIYAFSHSSSESEDSSQGYPRYWVTETGFKPNTNSDTRYWVAGRTYKWLAVWAPTT